MGEAVAREIGYLINSQWHVAKEAAQATVVLHRTIQEMLVRFCIWTLRALGDQAHYDERNEHAVLFCRRFTEWADNDGYARTI